MDPYPIFLCKNRDRRYGIYPIFFVFFRRFDLNHWEYTRPSFSSVVRHMFVRIYRRAIHLCQQQKFYLVLQSLKMVSLLSFVYFYFPFPLMFLSSDMDPGEIRFVRKAFIKERGTEVFLLNPPIPHPVRFRDTSYSCWQFGNANGGMKEIAP